MWSCRGLVWCGHKAWCARLAWLLKCICVLSREELDICNPPDLDMVAHAVLHWAGSCRQQFLHAGATVKNTYVRCFRTAPLGEESRPHPYLRAGLRIPHFLVLSMARSRLSSHDLGVGLGRHQGVVWFALGCKRCASLRMHDLPADDEAHLIFLCPATAVFRRERRFAQLPLTTLQDCCSSSSRKVLALTPTAVFALATPKSPIDRGGMAITVLLILHFFPFRHTL
jgi:hypothetical protein